MSMHILFGVKTDRIETARAWVEEATGRTSVARANDYVGDYYSFEDGSEEELKLCSGLTKDQEDHYPTEADYPDWKLLLYLDYCIPQSGVLDALAQRGDRFWELRRDFVEPLSRDVPAEGNG